MLLGKVNASSKQIGFDTNMLSIGPAMLGKVLGEQPAIRYGRYYFWPVSGNGVNFGLSLFSTGILAFSRILNDQEVLVLGNTIPQGSFAGEVIVDININGSNREYRVLFSNKGNTGKTVGPVTLKPGGAVLINEVDGSVSNGPVRHIAIYLASPGNTDPRAIGRPFIARGETCDSLQRIIAPLTVAALKRLRRARRYLTHWHVCGQTRGAGGWQ